MSPLVLLLIVFAVWAAWTGRLKRMTGTDGAMIGLAIVGAVMAAKGRIWIGGGALLLAAMHGIRRIRQQNRTSEPADVAEARALLGLAPDANEDEIREAHRRLIAKVHPDAGGTSALATKINDARNILLRHLLDNKGPHSASNP